MPRTLSILNPEHIEFFIANGYLILPNFFDVRSVSTLKQRALDLINAWEPGPAHSVFTTNDQKRVADQYFMESAYKIGYFLEEGAKDIKNKKHNSINKIAHALHDEDPVFESFSYSLKIYSILKNLGYNTPALVQSMYIMKPPGIGGEVKVHQDNSYIISTPLSCTGIWVAIEDALVNNACLYVIPGSHKEGCKTFWEKSEDGSMEYSNQHEYSKKGGICLEAEAGDAIILHGSLVHWSDKNLSKHSRHAYSLHAIETYETTWSPKCWLQRPKERPFKPWTFKLGLDY